MKSTITWTIGIAGLLALGATVALAQEAKPATYSSAAQVAERGRLATEDGYSVSVLRRTSPGQAEIHVKETDIFYVLDGSATIVTGGTVPDAKETAPEQKRGTTVTGGITQKLNKGDSMVIPAGTPHWFSEVPESITYYTVKVIEP